MSPDLYPTIFAYGFDTTHERRILDANFCNTQSIMYNAKIGDCLLELMDIAKVVERQSLTALIGASSASADA